MRKRYSKPTVRTSVQGSEVSVCDEHQVPLRFITSFKVTWLRPCAQGSFTPSRLSESGNDCEVYVELQPKPRCSGITHHKDFRCPYPKTSYHCASSGTPMTSVASFWWIWWSKTSGFFFCNRPSRIFFLLFSACM